MLPGQASFYPVLMLYCLLCSWLFSGTCRSGQVNKYRLVGWLVGEVADYRLSYSFNLEQVAVRHSGKSSMISRERRGELLCE